jgi:AcrR family transcriptional regulator
MQLLDCAQTIILERGLSSFTMEALAREAGVSNPLVYKYFATRLAILQELLLRETKRFNNIVYILRDQPDVFEAIAVDDRKQSGVMGRFLVQTLADQYTIDRKQAEQMVVLASGASQAAAAHYNRYGGDQAAMINDTVQFIFGGIDALLP